MTAIDRHTRRRQRGTTLLEALVAFLVLSLGMLTVVRVQTQLRLHSDVARQRSEAVRIGQQDMERLRAFSVVAASGSARSYAQIASAANNVLTNTAYLLTREVEPAVADTAKSTAISVAWTDRAGNAQQVALNSIISGTDPAYSGALATLPGATASMGPFGRAVAIPPAAKDLGNGSSAFKPVASGTLALVFENRSGLVTSRCTGVNAALATQNLTLADLTACSASNAYLLSGVVRFTSTSPPDPAQANQPPLALDVSLTLTGGSYPSAPQCSSEAQKTVSYPNAGGVRHAAVPIAASPASLGLAAWTETGDRFVAYHCTVVPLASGQWSGRSNIVANGWSIGTGTADRRICRYSVDLDASGGVEANVEHPPSYSNVRAALVNQNFLIINGTDNCPGALPVRIDGAGNDVFADLGTAPHQP